MTATSMTFGHTRGFSVPRGAILVGALVAAVLAGLRRLDHWQLTHRAAEPQTAEDVLAWARQLESTDPGFASDLRAAALRSMEDAE